MKIISIFRSYHNSYRGDFDTMTEAPTERFPLTQDSGLSEVTYAWVILFNYDINNSHPFSILPLNFFVDSDFPWEAVKGILSPGFRAEKRTLSKLPGNEYAIFAKVEIGNNNSSSSASRNVFFLVFET